MSETTPPRATSDVLDLDSGLAAFEDSPEFRGPVESLDGHHCNDHFALLYETRAEQFAAVVPFLRQGLERGERVMYVVDDAASEAAVIEAMREAGVDVDAHRESGALSFHSPEETYLRNGEFDPADMIEQYRAAIDEAGEGYAGLRIGAETGWLLDETASIEAFMDYESRVNSLFDGEDCIAMCQYDRTEIPAETIRDIVRTHPHLVCDSTVCHNFYYTPPEEYLGPDRPEREVDRMLGTLLDRTEARTALQERQRFLREQHDVTTDSSLAFEEKLQRLFELGCERFDLDVGAMARVDADADQFEIEHVSGDHEYFEQGAELPLSETYCTAAADIEAASVTDPTADGYGDVTVYEEFGITAYLGTYLEVDGSSDRTFFFAGSERRESSFSDDERTFLRLMGEWIKQELESHQRERDLRELYETAAAIELTFGEKVRRLLRLGRDRFGVEGAFLARTNGDDFEVVESVSDHEKLEPGASSSLAGTYCHRLLSGDDPLILTEASEEGWSDEPAYETYGLEAYAGTAVTAGTETYGTLCFVDESPRERPFSKAEKAFLDLLGQWVSYEIEREHREAQLGALNDMSRDLMSAGTVEEIADETVRHAEENLGLPITAVLQYDFETGALAPAAQTRRARDELPTASLCDRTAGKCWDAFVSEEVTVVHDFDAVSGVGDGVSAIVAVPLGKQGLFVTATESEGGFAPAEMDFAEATAATVADACVRADRERQLQERESTLEEQNESLQRLNRVNDIIRTIDKGLVQAASRAEIESVVCEQLADTGPYELAWIGERDQVTDEVTVSESAGTDRGYLDSVTIAAGDDPTRRGPSGRAIRTGEPQVTNRILSDDAFAEWREEALKRGYQSNIALPLVYEGTQYGVLAIYAGQPGVFDDLERTVLTELADNIAYAINAAESKKALVSDEVIELEFEVTDESFGIVDFVRAVGCEFSHEYLLPRSDGDIQAYFSTTGAPAEEILDHADRLKLDGVDDLALVSADDADGESVCLFEATLSGESLAAAVLDHGGRLHRVDAAGDTATVGVYLATDAAVPEFVDMLTAQYPGSELVAQRHHERPAETRTGFRATVAEELTDRQLEVLQTAYFGGYFEQPRTRSASDLAETLGIAQPTFGSHLRVAQRKLCCELFEEQPGV